MSNNLRNTRCGRPTPEPTTFLCQITGPIPTNGFPGGGPGPGTGVAGFVGGGPGGPGGPGSGCPGPTPVTFLCRIFGPVPGGPGGGPGSRFDQVQEFTMEQIPGNVMSGLGGQGTEDFQGGRPGPGPHLPVPGLYTLQVLAPVTQTNGPGGGPGGPGGGPGSGPWGPGGNGGVGGIGGGPGKHPCRPWGGPGDIGGGQGGPGGGPGGRPGTSPISCNYCFFNDVE